MAISWSYVKDHFKKPNACVGFQESNGELVAFVHMESQAVSELRDNVEEQGDTFLISHIRSFHAATGYAEAWERDNK